MKKNKRLNSKIIELITEEELFAAYQLKALLEAKERRRIRLESKLNRRRERNGK